MSVGQTGYCVHAQPSSSSTCTDITGKYHADKPAPDRAARKLVGTSVPKAAGSGQHRRPWTLNTFVGALVTCPRRQARNATTPPTPMGGSDRSNNSIPTNNTACYHRDRNPRESVATARATRARWRGNAIKKKRGKSGCIGERPSSPATDNRAPSVSKSPLRTFR